MKDLFTSRKFWGLIIGIVVLVVAQFYPGFEIDQERASALLVIAASYMVGVAVDPGPGGWRGVLLSRKFWAALVGLTIVITNALGIKMIFTEDQLVEIIVLISGYILSVAFSKPKNILMTSETLEPLTTVRSKGPTGQLDTRDVPR